MRRTAALALAATLLAALATVAAPAPRAGARFTLSEARTGAVSGPFTFSNGARVRLDGVLYALSIDGEGRVVFTAPDGAAHGPYQPVPGRLMQIGHAMYAFNDGNPSSISSGGTASRQRGPGREAPIATFEPLPPPPERIDIPPETPQRTAPALDLPSLPAANRLRIWSLWFAPIDRTPLKWQVEKVSGSKSDFKRSSFGAGMAWNSWLLDVAYSANGKSGSIVPSGLGFNGASVDDASGFYLDAGYKRPFLREGGWSASAGILGRIRQEKGDVSSNALIATGEADTNELGNVISKYESRSSSLKITETALRLDFELAYQYKDFHMFADLQVQPLSSVRVSGHLPYGDDNLSLSAKHDDAVGAMFGGAIDLKAGFYLSADLTLGYETRLRLALSRDW